MADGQYRIVEAQLPLIGGLGGHNFLVLLDPNEDVIGELHGLATDADGRVKPIGNLPSDRLKVHQYTSANYYDSEQAHTTLATGDQTTIMNLWNAAKAAGSKMDELDVQYPFLGMEQNSNSVASTLIAAMGLAEPPMRGGAPVMPGARSMLLDPKAIQDIQRQFNISASRTQDAPNPASKFDGSDRPSPPDSAKWPFGPVGPPSSRTTVPPAGNRPSGLAQPQPSTGIAIPRAEGSRSIGGPNGPVPLVPPARSRSQAPASPAPGVDPTLPPLHFIQEAPQNFGPFTVPGPSRSGASDGAGGGQPSEATASPTRRLTSMFPEVGPSGSNLPAPPDASAPAASPVMPGSVGQIGDGNGIGDWRNSLTPYSNIEPASVRRLTSRILGTTPADQHQSQREAGTLFGSVGGAPSLPPARSPLEALLALDGGRPSNDWTSPLPFRSATLPTQDPPGGIPGLLAQICAFDPDQPPAGGLLALLQEYMRNNPDDGATR